MENSRKRRADREDKGNLEIARQSGEETKKKTKVHGTSIKTCERQEPYNERPSEHDTLETRRQIKISV